MALTIVNSGVGAYLDGNAFIKTLMLGEPGAGKTRSASFWPYPIFANCERKSMSLLDRNVPSAQIGSLADMEQLLLLLRQVTQVPLAQRPEGQKWSTFVVDTFDAWQRTLITERLTKERREKFINDDWNWLGTKISTFLERVANLPMHVIINLHVKDVTEGEGDDKIVKSKPHLKGDVRDQIAAEFDLVGFMESYWSVEPVLDKPGERKKVLRRRVQWTQDEHRPILKDCSGQLGDFTDVDFTEDDFNRIWLPIMGRLDDLPASTVQYQAQTPAAPPAPVAPMQGGPVATPEKAAAAAAPPAKKAAAKKAAPAKKAAQPAPKQESGDVSAPPPDPAAGGQEDSPEAAPSPVAGTTQSAPPPAASNGAGTGVPVQQDAPGADEIDQAQQTLTDAGVATDVVSDVQVADPSPQQPSAGQPAADGSPAVCGDGHGDLQGCGRELNTLSQLERDRAELAFLRWRVRLCPDCFAKAKNNQLPSKSAA